LGHSFLINWDDRQYILENPLIRGLSWPHIYGAFTSFQLGNYAPLHMISYMVDYQIWGLRPFGFILSNIVLHTTNGVLFYFLLKRLAGEKVWIFAAALIFLIHPVQVESVAWVSERKNLLSMTFFLASFYWYVVYAEREKGAERYYALSLCSFVLALLTKAVVVVLPLALFLFDVCYGKKPLGKQSVRDKVPYLTAAAAFAALAVVSQSSEQGGATAFHGGSLFSTFLTMLTVLVSYLRMILWPVGLSTFYDTPLKTSFDLQVLGALLLGVGLVVMGGLLYRRRRDLFFWYAAFFVGLIPVSQIVPIVTLMNDRYLYFPMVGAASFLSAVLLADNSWASLGVTRRSLAGFPVMVLVIGAFAFVSFERVKVWQDSYTLWKDTVAKAPRVALAHDAFGEGLLQRGEIDEAIRQFRVAIRLERERHSGGLDSKLRATWAFTHNNLGTAYGMKGLPDLAIAEFSQALQLDPGLGKAHFNLGNALMQKGRGEEALLSFGEAVRLDPENPAYQRNLALTRQIVGGEMARGPGMGN